MLVYYCSCAFTVATLLCTGFIGEEICLVFLHAGSSMAAQLGAGAFVGANAEVQLSQREKCLYSYLASAPPWHLQMTIFKAHFSLWQFQSHLSFSLGAPTKATRDLCSMQDTLSTQTPLFPSQS